MLSRGDSTLLDHGACIDKWFRYRVVNKLKWILSTAWLNLLRIIVARRWILLLYRRIRGLLPFARGEQLRFTLFKQNKFFWVDSFGHARSARRTLLLIIGKLGERCARVTILSMLTGFGFEVEVGVAGALGRRRHWIELRGRGSRYLLFLPLLLLLTGWHQYLVDGLFRCKTGRVQPSRLFVDIVGGTWHGSQTLQGPSRGLIFILRNFGRLLTHHHVGFVGVHLSRRLILCWLFGG